MTRVMTAAAVRTIGRRGRPERCIRCPFGGRLLAATCGEPTGLRGAPPSDVRTSSVRRRDSHGKDVASQTMHLARQTNRIMSHLNGSGDIFESEASIVARPLRSGCRDVTVVDVDAVLARLDRVAVRQRNALPRRWVDPIDPQARAAHQVHPAVVGVDDSGDRLHDAKLMTPARGDHRPFVEGHRRCVRVVKLLGRRRPALQDRPSARSPVMKNLPGAPADERLRPRGGDADRSCREGPSASRFGRGQR